jgi:class 3 adenylate cyclase/DNA-binding CsgD family transcriptional regulator
MSVRTHSPTAHRSTGKSGVANRSSSADVPIDMRALHRHARPRGDADRGDVLGVGLTQYVQSGDGHVAFQVLGNGTTDVLLINESVLPIEALHDNVHTAAYVHRLASWGRVIAFDRRGVGLSDPVVGADPIALDDWVDDAIAVLDAAASERAVVISSGPSAGLIALRLAARCRERVSFLSVYDAIARYRWAPDYPYGVTDDADRQIDARIRADWGMPRLADRRGRFAATAARHPGFAEWATTWFRRGAGPATVAAQASVVRHADVRSDLASIACPTLIVNHAGVEDGRFLAARIAGSRYVELQDPCHLLFSSELDSVMALTSEAVHGSPVEPATTRVLTTVVFTDIVNSTGNLASIGDRRWGHELDHHYDMVRRHIQHFQGREVKTLGDGFIATFDGPSRAVQCALAIRHEAAQRGVAVRAGVHTGEVELRGDDVLGLTVHIGQRVCALATGAQVLVTQRVVDLVAGSDLDFDHRSDHRLKGVHGTWTVYEATLAVDPLTAVPAIGKQTVGAQLADLSAREREVLVALATGASNAEIAATLFMSEATAKAHVSHLFVKLRCTNRVQLAILAHRAGLTDR